MSNLDLAMSKLRREFIARLEGDATRLERASTNSEWQEMTAIAHQLVGAAGLFGWPEISALASDLEGALIEGRPEEDRSRRLKALTKAIGEAVDGAQL